MRLNYVLLNSVLLCAVSATSIKKRVDAETVDACLSGIQETDAPTDSLAKLFAKLFDDSETDSDQTLMEIMETAETVSYKIEAYNGYCYQVDSSLTPEQNEKLLKGTKPLISSFAEIFKLLVDNKDKALNVYNIGNYIPNFTKTVGETLGILISWEKAYGSDEVIEDTKEEIDTVEKLIDDIEEIYGN